VASFLAKLNYFLAGASAAGAGAAFLSVAAGAAFLSAGFTAAFGSAAGASAAIALNEIKAVITKAKSFFIYYSS
jgi:hypothetical protein